MRSAAALSPHTSSRRLSEITWIQVDFRKSRRTTPRGRGGARRRRALPLVRAGGGGTLYDIAAAVLPVIRRRLEDTVKMAVVSALARRPLEQVGGSDGPDHLARSLSPPLSGLSLSPPGVGAAEEALPPDGAGGAAGNSGTPPGPSSPVEAGVAPAQWWVGAERRGGGGLGAASCRGLAPRLLRPSAEPGMLPAPRWVIHPRALRLTLFPRAPLRLYFHCGKIYGTKPSVLK